MSPKQRKSDLALITKDFNNRIVGRARALVSEELQRAVVAQSVMNLMVTRGEFFPDRSIGDYTALYFDAIAALMIDDRDPEVAKEVAEKFGI